MKDIIESARKLKVALDTMNQAYEISQDASAEYNEVNLLWHKARKASDAAHAKCKQAHEAWVKAQVELKSKLIQLGLGLPGDIAWESRIGSLVTELISAGLQ